MTSLTRVSVSDQKRLRLIAAASRLFSEQGVGPTSIDDVAVAINAVKGAVYHYSENKNELPMACCEPTPDLLDLFIGSAEPLAQRSDEILLLIIHFHRPANASLRPTLVPHGAPSSLNLI